MNLADKFQSGLPYADFLARYADAGQKDRWQQAHARFTLSAAQRELIGQFRREMNVLCLAGTWCGDCINQCPTFEHFAAAAPTIRVRYLDRDEHADVQEALRINGGHRVPVLVFLSEDGQEVARYGERTLGQYRQMMRSQLGPQCPPGIPAATSSLQDQVVQDWLDEFERVQWMLRLSPRLRQRHGD